MRGRNFYQQTLEFEGSSIGTWKLSSNRDKLPFEGRDPLEILSRFKDIIFKLNLFMPLHGRYEDKLNININWIFDFFSAKLNHLEM